MEKNDSTSNLFLEKRKRYYFELIIPAIIVLIGGYMLWRGVLLPLYIAPIPNYVLIFILFAAMTMVYTLLCGCMELLLKRIFPYESPMTWKRILVFTLAGGMAVGLLAGVLEFLYELEQKEDTVIPADEIVFVIDDSSSMVWNDYNNVRLSSAKEITDRLSSDKRVGLVRFQDKVTTVVPIDQLTYNHKSVIANNLYEERSGGTDIGKALWKAIELYQEESSDSYSDSANRTILLLTDGMSEPFDESAMIEECKNNGIQINAISLGSNTDMSFLKRITSNTGGNLCKIPNADTYYINIAYSILIGEDVRRCLLVPTILIYKSRLFLRVLQWLFLTIIGLALESVVAIMMKYPVYIKIHAFCSPCTIIFASFLVAVTNANTFFTLLLLNAYLIPFYMGRIIVGQRIRLPRIFRIHVKPHYKEREVTLISGYTSDRIGKVNQHYWVHRL